MNKKLNITYLSPGWPLSAYPNGIVAYIKSIISGFDDNVEASIIAHRVQGQTLESIINLSQLIQKKSFNDKLQDKILFHTKVPFAQQKLYERRIKGVSNLITQAMGMLPDEPDLIEIEESFGYGQWLTASTDIPVITRLHGPWFIMAGMQSEEDDSYAARVRCEGNAIKLSQGITAPSLDVLNKVREYYNCLLPEAKVIPNPAPAVAVNEQWKLECSLKQTILFVGRFDLTKGGDLAIDAFRIIANHNREIELIFVGPDRGVPIKGKIYSFEGYIEKFVPEASIKDRIQFLGHCETEKIAALRKTSTVTMMTSRYDNFPMSLLEAIATGSPVICTAVGGMKEIIINDFNGLLADPESANSIAENVLTLLGDVDKMKTMSKNAIKDSQERFSASVVAKQTEEYYRSILTDQP
ncbi:MAG: glycosyltransferase family 4 protein [Methylophaga sp.]|nr:glycosyltransferase family 4 protein [Methylophaga sp.]